MVMDVLIFKMFACKGVKINAPPFMDDSGQFNESELLETKRIAYPRIDAERAIERIKNYQILNILSVQNYQASSHHSFL